MHDPLRLAEDAAVVDVISGGRFILGLGLAWLPWELEAFGTSMRERVARTESAIRICRQAWGDGLVEEFGVAVTPKPAQPGGPPIWLGGHRERAIRRAGRIADGWMAGESDPDELRGQVEWLRDETASAGRSGDEVGVAGHWPVFVGEATSRAWEDVRAYVHYVEWKYDDQEGGKGRTGPPGLPPALDDDVEQVLRATTIVGDPDHVTERIRELADAAGPGFTFIARMYYPGMDRGLMRRSTGLFAQHVIPALRTIGEGAADQ
jgi:alkanesulfonate monooxygenase SsuD/methylene tetrahydromethanopterin reductase-like flavin-dependent oxidoreductase (luciferase family)